MDKAKKVLFMAAVALGVIYLSNKVDLVGKLAGRA